VSFIVSNTFNPRETIDVSKLIKLFQFRVPKFLKHASGEPAFSSCFNVSVVSINNFPPLKILQKVFTPPQRACVSIVVRVQDYTKELR